MLDKIIKKQLESLEVARVDQYIEDKHRYLFRRVNVGSLEIGKHYIISLSKKLTNINLTPTLANNWNHGLVPIYTLMQIEVKEQMGNMYKVHGDYLNDDYSLAGGCGFWEGWLPLEDISVVKEI